jgi:uncharacterized protein YcfL
MSKLVLVFVMLTSMVFASCGNSTKSSDVQNDSVNVDSIAVVDSVAVTDSVIVDSTTVSLD